MHSEEQTGKARLRSPRVLVAAVFLLAAAVVLLVMSLVEGQFFVSLRSRRGFRLEGGEKVFYAQAGNGLCAATTTNIQLFTSGGKTAARQEVDMIDPACSGSSLLGAYYDIGRNGLYALYPDGRRRYTDTEGPVVFASVNETGLVSVIMEKSGYKGSVMVYDTDLSPLFRWDAGSGYPVAARISRDDVLCVGCASGDGSALRFFRIDREDEQASLELPGELLLDIGFLSDGTLCAVTAGRLLMVSPDGGLTGEYPFRDRHLDGYWLRGSFAAVSTVSGTDGGSAVLATLDGLGRILGERAADRSVLSLSGAGDRLLVLFQGRESTLYSSALVEEVSYQPPEDVTQAFLFPDGRALFGGAERATPIDFDR